MQLKISKKKTLFFVVDLICCFQIKNLVDFNDNFLISFRERESPSLYYLLTNPRIIKLKGFKYFEKQQKIK